MLLAILLLIIGLAILVKGADIFVDASVGIAETLNVPKIMIGLTIVAIGTATPEITVSVIAARSGQTSMALGNLIGSNVFNLIAILGICGLISPFQVSVKTIAKDFMLSILVAGVVMLLFFGGHDYISPWVAGSLMVFFLGYIGLNLYKNGKEKQQESIEAIEAIEADHLAANRRSQRRTKTNSLLVVLGIAMVVGGAQLAVDHAVFIAAYLGVEERVIGLTILAIGTSLPEFVTSIVAFKKGEGDLAMGNIIGSNILNLTFVLGLVGVISPIAIETAYLFDTAVLIVGSLLTFLFIFTGKKVVRLEGALLVAIYVGYLYLLI